MLSGKCLPIDLCNTELPQTSDSIKYSYLHSTVKGDMPVSFHLYKFLDAIPVAKTWKKAKCPSTNKWIKMMWYIHNGILLSH